MTRRQFVIGGLGVATGALAGVAADQAVCRSADQAASASAMGVPAPGPWRPADGRVDVTWAVDTDHKLVALTFDDGPMPRWTPMVLNALDAEKARATFFFVGERLVRHGRLVAGRMHGHEVGNHTWQHQDLSRLSYDQARTQIAHAHSAIAKVTGQEARHLRPPYGRLDGSTLSAAGSLGYDLTLWSLKMREAVYRRRPAALVDYIVGNTAPGTILLAHDTGRPDRLVALRQLVPMIRGLRAKGFEFVTVSELAAASAPAGHPATARATLDPQVQGPGS